LVKSVGITRRIDELGRLVLPVELRRLLGIEDGDSLDIYVDGDRIVLQKVEERCTFCGSESSLRLYRSKQVCGACVGELSRRS
jgi:AbrB family transcriptional regulator, transcriptional pleiotropic regulator of transition state genes